MSWIWYAGSHASGECGDNAVADVAQIRNPQRLARSSIVKRFCCCSDRVPDRALWRKTLIEYAPAGLSKKLLFVAIAAVASSRSPTVPAAAARPRS
jgi:hypothetical protein